MKEKAEYRRSDFNLDIDLLLEYSLDLVYIHDLTGRFLDANDLTLETLGYERHEIRKIKFRNLIDGESLNTAFLILKELIETGKQSERSEYKLKNRSGKDIYLNTYAIPLKKDGKLFAILGIARDVTEQRKAEEAQKILVDRILKSSQFKSDFMASMSHELRTPLNAILGFTELLSDKAYGELSESQLDYLNDISSSSTHLLSIVNGILDISKIEAGELKLNLTTFKLREVIVPIKSIFRPLYAKKGLDFLVKIDDTIDQITADKLRLRQILYNIIGNAIKFTEAGSIAISIKENEEFFIFTIYDTGIGIAEENFQLIFEEFKQIQGNIGLPGTGLGLPLVKRLVNLHGGNITFESKLGEGSSFTFTIPKHNT